MKRGFEITADGICDYIVAYKNSMSPTSVSTWVTAVKRYAAIKHGMVITTLDGMVCRFLQEGVKQGKPRQMTARAPTGNLDHEQLGVLITRTDIERHLCDGLVLAHATGLRTMRVSALRHHQMKPVLTPDGEDGFCFHISVPRDKAPHCSAEPATSTTYTDPYWNDYLKVLYENAATEYENILERQRDPDGAVVVPGWTGSAPNKAIAKYAKQLGWDPTLTWTTQLQIWRSSGSWATRKRMVEALKISSTPSGR